MAETMSTLEAPPDEPDGWDDDGLDLADDLPADPMQAAILAGEVKEHGDDYDPVAAAEEEAAFEARKGSTATATADDEGGRERSSWWPHDLGDVLAGKVTGPKAVLLEREDGIFLLYRGRVHFFYGEPEALKSWLAEIGATQVVRAGGRVLYLEHEGRIEDLVERFQQLGLTDDEINDRVHIVTPDESLVDGHGRITNGMLDLNELLDSYRYDLIVIDGVTVAMEAQGLEPESNRDFATFVRVLVKRCAEHGAAVVLIDHVTKSKESRGDWAFGAQHKKASVNGASYNVTNTKPFGRGLSGSALVTLTKDKGGDVRRHAEGKRMAELHMASDPETGAITYRLAPPTPATTSPITGEWRPTIYMERVSRFLEAHPEGASLRAIRAGVKGGNEHIDSALRVLGNEGHIDPETRALLAPYVEADDPLVSEDRATDETARAA